MLQHKRDVLPRDLKFPVFLSPLPVYLCSAVPFVLASLFGHVSLCQANKIMEHRRKYERKREEKLIRERQERVKKAREEHARAQRVRNESSCLDQGKPLHVSRNWNAASLCLRFQSMLLL